MSRGNSEYDLRDENQVKEYLKNVLVEYQFSCFKEKDPTGFALNLFRNILFILLNDSP